jgi:antitoxin component YwqK of YwqJK toxin-antitoxin module
MRCSSIVLSIVLILLSCSGENSKKKNKSPKKDEKALKDGVTKSYYADGKLRAEVPFKNGRRNGLAVEYYNNGKKYLEINYVNGRNHGLSTRYYDTGGLYEETMYENGEMHGIRKRYRKDGKLSAEAPYNNGFSCLGLKEYLVDGRPKKNFPTIEIQPVDRLLKEDRYILRLSMSDKTKNVIFYQGKLEGKCLGYSQTQIPMSAEKGVGELVFNLPKGMFVMDEISIVAKVKTPLGNYYVTEKKYNLAIENR